MGNAISPNVKILSRERYRFSDRSEAGCRLGDALHCLKGPHTVVLGIPRGGLVVAREVAKVLRAPLDIVLSRKLGAPANPELAIGSVAEDGRAFVDPDAIARENAGDAYLKVEVETQAAHIKRQRDQYRQVCSKIDLRRKDVIVIDDGIATGSTVQAALWSIRQEAPRIVVAAFPVGTEGALHRLGPAADEIACLMVPERFGSVGQFYRRFDQVSDEDVFNILKECGENI